MIENIPHPKNTPGPFYVVNGCCVTCMAPHSVAPEMMAFDEEENHCYVSRQPVGSDEMEHAILAIYYSEMGCLRYGGEDPEVLTRLIELGEGEQCDAPVPVGVEAVLRNHLTFASSLVGDASVMAEYLKTALCNGSSCPLDFGPMRRRGEKCGFWISWYQGCHPLEIQPRGPGLWFLRHSVSRARVGSRGVTFLLDRVIRSDAQIQHLRWFSADEWRSDQPGKELPY